MQVQERRDQKTVTIAIAIGVFVLIVIVGAVSLAVADSAFTFSDRVADALRLLLFAIAGCAVVVYLARSRRR